MDLPERDPTGVLAQPSRARLFALLSDLRRPAGTDELAALVGLHPNGVRLHLERLREAGLVERTRVRRPRGRPRDEWRTARDARPGGDPPQAYADLGRWLARAIPAKPGRLRDVEAAGREIGRELAPRDATSARQAVEDSLVALGFQPDVQSSARGVRCTLRNCPYRNAARESQEVVCTLHRGITRGLLDVIDPDARLRDFVPHDPDRAGCVIEIDVGS